jgi:hypothetical protein
MSLLNVKQRSQIIVGHGGGHLEVWGIAQFSTTDANGDIEAKGKLIEDFQLTPLGVTNTDENLYLNNGAPVDGFIVRPATGLINIARTGTKTNGLWFSFRYKTNA